MNNSKRLGFTLIELLVTIAVIAILATVALPGFQSMFATNRLAADVNEILSGISYARSEAVKRRAQVVFDIVQEDQEVPWSYSVYVSDDDGLNLRERVSRDSRVQVSVVGEVDGGAITFNALGRVSECDLYDDGDCRLSISLGSSRVRDIFVAPTGRIERGGE